MFVTLDIMMSLVALATVIKMMWWTAAEDRSEARPTVYIHPRNYPWWYLGKTHL